MKKNVYFSHLLTALFIVLFSNSGFSYTSGIKKGPDNPHLLSSGEWSKWRVLCSKLDNEIEALHRRMNVLKDAVNHRENPDAVKAIAASVKSGIDEIFNEVNSELCEGKLFISDSRTYMGKIDNLRRSLHFMGGSF
jgi:hypothetical protein